MSYQYIQKPTSRPVGKLSQLREGNLLQVFVAIVFVSFYSLEALHGPTIKPLWALQQNELYKQFTGFALLVYVLCQWRLARLRMGGEKIDHKRELNLHIWFGVFTPLALYVHSSQLGYGYQVLLAGVFLLNVLLGLCSPKFLKIRHRQYVVVWLVVHSGIAILVPVLLMYHIYVIYFYD
ncbi:MAG: hypothetical protein PVF82_21125 [Gammaproteobacteria bacterium]|jgi:hypothetical protein